MLWNFLNAAVEYTGFYESRIYKQIYPPVVAFPVSGKSENLENRVNDVFQSLMKYPQFEKVWEEGNSGLHEKIKIVPSAVSNQKDISYVFSANFTDVKCSDKCLPPNRIPSDLLPPNPNKLDRRFFYPHSFKITINAFPERTIEEIAASIIIELHNLKQWPAHATLNFRVKYAEISDQTAVLYARSRERVEWNAMKEAKKIGDSINPVFLADYPENFFTDFDSYLEAQKANGHYDWYIKEYENLRLTGQLTPPSDVEEVVPNEQKDVPKEKKRSQDDANFLKVQHQSHRRVASVF